MSLEAIFGTVCVFGVRGLVEEVSEVTDGFLFGVAGACVSLETASGSAVGGGGGNGDIEMLVMDAECAW